MAKKIQDDDEFEEFEEDEDEEESEEEETEEELPKLPKKPEVKYQQQIKKAVKEEDEGDEDAEQHFRNAVKKQKKVQPEVLQDEVEHSDMGLGNPEHEPKIQYVAVPRAVSIEMMFNEIADKIDTLQNTLNQILQTK